MKTVQLQRKKDSSWHYLTEKSELKEPLVLVFGNRHLLENENIYNEVKSIFTDGHIVFGSTSGDITSEHVEENCITITAIEFEKSNFLIKRVNVLESNSNSFDTGQDLIKQFPKDGLKHVFVVSEGSFINGSELTQGMNSATDNNLLITGGLCGDDARFQRTLASYNENPKRGEVVAIGLYGDSLEISFSINGGWTPFGPERVVTKSKTNILYELDNKPALDLYKKYLGDKSKDLPGAALLYPLKVKSENEDKSIVRTILNIDEKNHSMILAGNVLEGQKVQLMMTHVDSIVNASELAATNANKIRVKDPELAILVSCVGRKLVLDQRVEEEVEEVIEAIGDNVTICGMYSYGEIAPFDGEKKCQLHNQTMTVTLISE
ncbi:histidine kinase [Tenacibaculum sp. SZ-18]|uniref:FIST signal transduction protein n=1 Tax=Tenacibaculum sp. SZ-18 TaxID=754423 RepID=UPI000C2D4DEC|nr:FIST N-terminal domain-containing protein [Tenacibaculum sp. SZ-18]AUC15244.1 histidine kinase [Tenacibaculum sp. SZ-18]